MILPYKVTGYTVEEDGELVFAEFHNEASSGHMAERCRHKMENQFAPGRLFVVTECELDLELICMERHTPRTGRSEDVVCGAPQGEGE